MDLQTYQAKFGPEGAPGWDAIDAALERIYAEREPDWHLAATPHFSAGGSDPLDGVSIYRRKDPAPHYHLISYGMTELYYNEDAIAGEYSKWGFEFTFRLSFDAADSSKDTSPTWVAHLMQNLARYVYQSEKWFEHGHLVATGGPIKANSDTKLEALIFMRDPELAEFATVHGKVEFLQVVGITKAEHLRLKDDRGGLDDFLRRLQERFPLGLTDLNRDSLI